MPVGPFAPDHTCGPDCLCGGSLLPKEKRGPDDIRQEDIVRGELSATYDEWVGKMVKVRGRQGKVFGVDSRPRYPRELPTVESGWLYVDFGNERDAVLPQDCEVVG